MCTYGLYGTIWETWCHIRVLYLDVVPYMVPSMVPYHILCCGTCEIRRDAHVTSIQGTMYEMELVIYGRTHMKLPYMAPCMNWNLRNMELRKCHSHTWHHVWNRTCELWKDAQVTSIYGSMYGVERLLRFCRTGFTGSFSKHCKIRQRADLFDFHPRLLKCRHRGVSVRARPWMIAYSNSGWTTNTKTGLSVHKSHDTQIRPQIFTISTPIFSSYIRAYLLKVGHGWLQILAQHERLIRKQASNCNNRTIYTF